MELPSAGEWIALAAFLVTGCIIAAIIETWWEQRKREKERKR